MSITEASAQLLKFVQENDGTIKMAGPPHMEGTLAKFFKSYPESANFIKTYEINGCKKPGIVSFLHKSTTLKIEGRHPNNVIVVTNKKAVSPIFSFAAREAMKRTYGDNMKELPVTKFHGSHPNA